MAWDVVDHDLDMRQRIRWFLDNGDTFDVAIVLRRVFGHSAAEIARDYDVSRAHIHNRMSYVKSMMQGLY
jgi:DNA-directed RNA polymerase specialized sigma24 family protein